MWLKAPVLIIVWQFFFFVCGGQELLNELASLIGIDKNISVSDLRAVCGLGYIRDIFGTYSGHMRDI